MFKVKKSLLLASLRLVVASSTFFPAHSADRFATYANPVDSPYRYQFRSLREAADLTMVWFKVRHWLFASHSKGYW